MALLYVATALLFSVGLGSPQDLEIGRLSEQFNYNESIPLDVERTLVEETDGTRVYDISYASPKGGRVSAYLVVPPGEEPHPAIVFAHWGLGTRVQYLPEAKLYAEAGAASLLVDYPWGRSGESFRPHSGYTDAENDRELYIHAVVDIRRGLDLLVNEPYVDPGRIAYVGHSIGAQLGGILSAVDRRIKTVVLIGGTPGLEAMLLDETVRVFEGYRNAFGHENIVRYIELSRSLDAVNYVPHASPTSILFQFGRFEQFFGREAMRSYAEAASRPKRVEWYATDHEMNEIQALVDRARWLQEALGLDPIQPILARKMSP